MPEKLRHLITTADKRSWTRDNPVLIINDLCSHGEAEKYFGSNRFLIQPRFKTQQQLRSDYQYLANLYEQILADLSENLNLVHDKKYSVRYWRILVGPWLAFFIHIFHDRWSDIKFILENFNISSSTLLELDPVEMVPNDMSEFVEYFVSDEWNHYIYGVILQEFPEVNLLKKSLDATCKPRRGASKSSIKLMLARAYSKFSSKLMKGSDSVLVGTYLSHIDDFKLQLMLLQFPQIFLSTPPPRVAVIDLVRRNLLTPKSSENSFENLLYKMISLQIPRLYLEGYESLIACSRSLGWPTHPKAIFSSNALFYDSVCMAYAAEKVINGAFLIYGQHGGTYGVSEFSWYEDHEIQISDKYLTWGWGYGENVNIRPVGMLNPPKARIGPSNLKKRLLFVGYTLPRYLFITWSESLLMGKKYIRDSFLFAGNLDCEALPHLKIRLHSYDYGWKQADLWRESFPSVEIDCGSSTMAKLLEESRIVVYTYNGTGLLEALSANIPAVFYWDSELSTLRESAIGYFEELRAVGIFHDSPCSAAEHINANWHDIDAWWNSNCVQTAIKRFSENYCKVNKNLLRDICDAMHNK